MKRLRTQCEEARRTLSAAHQVSIKCEALADGEDFDRSISRDQFEEICSELFNKCLPPVENLLQCSGLEKGQINEVVLVGDAMIIPKVQ